MSLPIGEGQFRGWGSHSDTFSGSTAPLVRNCSTLAVLPSQLSERLSLAWLGTGFILFYFSFFRVTPLVVLARFLEDVPGRHLKRASIVLRVFSAFWFVDEDGTRAGWRPTNARYLQDVAGWASPSGSSHQPCHRPTSGEGEGGQLILACSRYHPLYLSQLEISSHSPCPERQ